MRAGLCYLGFAKSVVLKLLGMNQMAQMFSETCLVVAPRLVPVPFEPMWTKVMKTENDGQSVDIEPNTG